MNKSTAVLFFLSLLLFSFSIKNVSAQSRGFSNPILAGFYPDPSICRVGSNYYLVNSTFSYFPGITVFQSKDLVNWKLIGYVLDRPEKFNLDHQGVSRGIFAPVIRYNKGLFYVTCTFVDIGGNFVATAKDPAGPWSDPVWLPQINGIDPSLFFDENGKAYIIYNSIPPDDKPLYQGHRTIRMYEFDASALKVKGEEHLLINGGTDIRRNPVWIEAPHILQKDGYYYLIAAEGGTFDQHSEVVFRSKNVFGPYVSYENNPILTQRHLDPKRENAITCTGHADFVQTESGSWWAVFLGCRPYAPYEENCFNTGRETFLAPVEWNNGWPVINPGNELVKYHYPNPVQPLSAPLAIPFGGNFLVRDEFNTEQLDLNWAHLRTPHEKWLSLSEKKGYLSIKLRPETCSGVMNPSFLGRRQQHLTGYASASLTFSPVSENEKAGLLVFQNENHFYFICKSLSSHQPVVQLYKSAEKSEKNASMELIASRSIPAVQSGGELRLKIESHGKFYAFSVSDSSGHWNMLKDSVDAKYLSTKVAGGFVGCLYALYATSTGVPSTSVASFDWFEYRGDDEVYK